jgi:putative flippase GtrA
MRWRLHKQLAWFGVGGAIGGIVDAGLVQLLVSVGHANPYVARLVSFLCAATATWAFNREVTFPERGNYTLFGEWSRYVLAMLAGFAVNYAAYTALVHYFVFFHTWPGIGAIVGGMPGSAVNFLGARQWVFSKSLNPRVDKSRKKSNHVP